MNVLDALGVERAKWWHKANINCRVNPTKHHIWKSQMQGDLYIIIGAACIHCGIEYGKLYPVRIVKHD